MKIDTNSLVSITEANQNFSRVAHLVDENGAAVILKNNTPRYIVIQFSEYQAAQTARDDDVSTISQRILSKHLSAYEELAK